MPAALATFAALLPVGTAIAFFGLGAAKSAALGRSGLRAGLETLLTGGRSCLASVVGALLRATFGAA